MEQNSYNVLWVEDNDKIVEGYQSRARRAGLNLVRVSNWDEAKKKLDADFEDYSAIILDAACKIHETDEIDKESFIPVVLPKLSEIFATKQKYIPWYILSAGTMTRFDFVVDAAQEYRVEFKEEWGEMVFKKDAPADEPSSPESLFRQICKVAEEKAQNSVLYRHQSVFSYLGTRRLINYRQAREYMLKMLDALYFPEDHLKYEYEGNPLRKVLEYLFRAAAEKGLLPKDCFDVKHNDGNVVLQNAFKFMSGKDVVFSEGGQILYKVRWGKAGDVFDGSGKGCDRIFDKETEACVKSVLDYANRESHSGGDETYVINAARREVFFANVMYLCHIIRQFGKYVEKHPDVEKNRKMHRRIENDAPAMPEPPKPEKKKPTVISKEDMVGKEGYVLNTDKFSYVLSCILSPECAALVKVSDRIRIDDVEENSDEKTKKKYPFIATKITPVAEE